MKFLISLAILMVVLMAAVYLGEGNQWFSEVPSFTLEIILFLGISTGGIFFLLVRKARSQSFTQAYLLSIVLKMFVYSAFILVIIFMDRPNAFANAVLFMVSYVLLTALEVGFLFQRVNS